MTLIKAFALIVAGTTTLAVALNLGIGLLLSSTGVAPTYTPSPPEPTTIPQLEQMLTADCSAGRFSGVVIARKERKIVFRHICGLANVAAGTPITEATRFKIFSVSKSFTGSVIMTLVDRGLMALDVPAQRYIPEMPEEWREITVLQLLNHTSGIPDITEKLLHAYQADAASGYDGAMHDVLTHLTAEDKAIKGVPGTNWVYNNFGYELLARAIENVTHHSYETEITQSIFIPADMKTAEIAKPRIEKGQLAGSQPSPGLAQGYNGKPGALEPADSFQFVQMGAGAIYADAQDMLNFDSALSRGAIVSSKVVEDCRTHAFFIKPDVSYGCGWMLRTVGNETYFQHDGGNNGFVTDFARAPQKDVVVVVMSNLGFVDPGNYRRPLVNILLNPSSQGH